jgi:hypothetical protein
VQILPHVLDVELQHLRRALHPLAQRRERGANLCGIVRVRDYTFYLHTEPPRIDISVAHCRSEQNLRVVRRLIEAHLLQPLHHLHPALGPIVEQQFELLGFGCADTLLFLGLLDGENNLRGGSRGRTSRCNIADEVTGALR